MIATLYHRDTCNTYFLLRLKLKSYVGTPPVEEESCRKLNLKAACIHSYKASRPITYPTQPNALLLFRKANSVTTAVLDKREVADPVRPLHRPQGFTRAGS